VLDNGEGRAPQQQPGPAPTTTTAMLPDQDDPRRIGELLATWVGVQLEAIDAMVAEGQAKVAALPNLRDLWALFGELVVRVHFLESEVERLKGERR
jgi:hypothetical protein